MSAIENSLAGSRSDRRIPKLRTRGRASRERLLAVAQDLIEESGSRPIRFSEVFEAAGVSRLAGSPRYVHVIGRHDIRRCGSP